MPQQIVNNELFKLNPSSLLELWTLDGSTAGLDILYHFFDGSNNNYQPITFNSVQYTPFAIKLDQMDYDSKSLVRPRLSVANINGFISMLLMGSQDIIGSKVTRTKVFARFLDASNFANNINPYGAPDPTAILSTDIFYINRKIQENNDVVSFELVSPIEIDNVQLPNRQMLANACTISYRDYHTCGYVGKPVADKKGKPFEAGGYGYTLNNRGLWVNSATYNIGDYVYIASQVWQNNGVSIYYVCSQNGVTGSDFKPAFSSVWIADACQYNVRACKAHFTSGPLPISAFPGISRTNLTNNGR